MEFAHIGSVVSVRPDCHLTQQAGSDRSNLLAHSCLLSCLVSLSRFANGLSCAVLVRLSLPRVAKSRLVATRSSFAFGFPAPPNAATFKAAQPWMNRSTLLDDQLSNFHANQRLLCESITLPCSSRVIYVSDMRFYGQTRGSFSEFCWSVEPSYSGPVDASRQILLSAGTTTKSVTCS